MHRLAVPDATVAVLTIRVPPAGRRVPSRSWTRIDVHLGAAGRGRPVASRPSASPARTAATSSSPTTRATSGDGSTRPDAYRSIAPARPSDPPRMPTTVTSLSATRRLSTWLGRPASPIQTTRRPGSTRSTARAGSSAALEASTTASNATLGIVSAVQTWSNPRERANAAEASRWARRWTSMPRAAAIRATSSPIVPVPSTRSRSPAARAAASTARQALPPGSTRAPRVSSTASGSASSDQAGTASRSARAPGHPRRMPTSARSAHRCRRPERQRSQTPQPSIVSPVTRRPSHDASTPPPTADTVPHHSCPIRSG